MTKRVMKLMAGLILLFTPLSGEAGKPITLVDAIGTAVARVPGRVIKAEQVADHFQIRIETEGGTEEEVRVDAESGRIIEDAPVTEEEAKALALKEVPGEVEGVVTEKDLYRVRIRAGTGTLYEVMVYAKSGNVAKKKKRTYHYNEEFDTWSE